MTKRAFPRKIVFFSILLLIAAAAGWYVFVYSQSDEAKIRSVLETLCSIGSKSPGDGAASSVQKLRALESVSADEVDFDLDNSIFSGRMTISEFSGNVVRFRALFREVKIAMRDLEITVESPDSAKAFFTGSLDGVGKPDRGVGRVSEVRDIFCRLRKIDGSWKIVSLDIEKVLQK